MGAKQISHEHNSMHNIHYKYGSKANFELTQYKAWYLLQVSSRLPVLPAAHLHFVVPASHVESVAHVLESVVEQLWPMRVAVIATEIWKCKFANKSEHPVKYALLLQNCRPLVGIAVQLRI